MTCWKLLGPIYLFPVPWIITSSILMRSSIAAGFALFAPKQLVELPIELSLAPSLGLATCRSFLTRNFGNHEAILASALPKYNTPVFRFRQIGNEERDKPQSTAHTRTIHWKDTYTTALAQFSQRVTDSSFQIKCEQCQTRQAIIPQREKNEGKTLELGILYWG